MRRLRKTLTDLLTYGAHQANRFLGDRLYCGQTVGWIKMKLGMKIGLGPDDFVLDWEPATPKNKGTAPTQFSAHVYCGQTAGWMKMPLGTELDLGP